MIQIEDNNIYNIKSTGKTEAKALSELEKKIETANKKLEKENLNELELKKAIYSIDCKIAKEEINENISLTKATYQSTSLDNAKNIAEKYFQEKPFEITKVCISHFYEVTKEQLKALRNSKTSPAGPCINNQVGKIPRYEIE